MTGQLVSQIDLPLLCEAVVLMLRPRLPYPQPPDHRACVMVATPGLRAPDAPGSACARTPAAALAGRAVPRGHPLPPPPTPRRSLLAPARTPRLGPAQPPALVQARSCALATPQCCSPWDANRTPQPRVALHQVLPNRAGPAYAPPAADPAAFAAVGTAGRAIPPVSRLRHRLRPGRRCRRPAA